MRIKWKIENLKWANIRDTYTLTWELTVLHGSVKDLIYLTSFDQKLVHLWMFKFQMEVQKLVHLWMLKVSNGGSKVSTFVNVKVSNGSHLQWQIGQKHQIFHCTKT